MALGISGVFPMASFLHAKVPEDLKFHHLQRQKTVILVDSVINSGKTIVEFVEHIRKLQANEHINAQVRIIVVSIVVQAQSVSDGGLLSTLSQNEKVDLNTRSHNSGVIRYGI